MSILPKVINRFNTILSKIPTAFLEEIDKSILRFICNLKTLIAKTSLKIIKLEVTQLFQNYHKAKLIKVAEYWHEDRETRGTEQMSEMNSCVYGQMMFPKVSVPLHGGRSVY